jgi:hypothetical protein
MFASFMHFSFIFTTAISHGTIYIVQGEYKNPLLEKWSKTTFLKSCAKNSEVLTKKFLIIFLFFYDFGSTFPRRSFAPLSLWSFAPPSPEVFCSTFSKSGN